MTETFSLHKLLEVERERVTDCSLNILTRNHAPLYSAICKTFTSQLLIVNVYFLSWDVFKFHHNCDTVLMIPSLSLIIAANSH